MSQRLEDLKDRLLAAVENGSMAHDGPIDEEIQTLLHAVETAPADFLKPAWELMDDTRPEVLPRSIGNYEIKEILGIGGMGVVYQAVQPAPLNQSVALKILRPGTLSDTSIARFELERDTLARLDHPGIAKVLDTGNCENGQPFIVMELVEGPTVTQYVREKRLSLEERIELFRSVCLAVAHAHARGVIHRDLKPNNILIEEQDGQPVPKVIDFGIAKVVDPDRTKRLTLTAQVLGTLEYLSPEVLEHGAAAADARSDVFALGAILYELITDAPPVTLNREVGVIQALKERENAVIAPLWEKLGEASSQHPVSASDMRKELNCIALHALESEPDCRYQSPQELADDLNRYLTFESIKAAPPTNWRALQNFIRRNRVAVATAATVFVALAVSLGVMVVSYFQVERSMEVAVRAQRDAEEAIELLSINTEVNGAQDRAATVRLAEFGKRVETLLDETDLASPKMQLALELKLADSYDNSGKFDDANRVLHKAYASTEESWAGPEDRFRSSLAFAEHYIARKRYADAMPFAATAVDLMDAGTESTRFDAEFALANTLMGTGKLKESAELFESVLTSNADEADPKTGVPRAKAKVMYATVLFQLGRADQAVIAAAEGYEAHRDVYGVSYPNTLTAGHNLATLYSLTLQKEKAIELFREILATRKLVLGSDHPDTLMTSNLLANNLVKTGKELEAETFFHEALETGDQRYGDENPAGLLATVGLAKLHVKRNEFEQAIASMHRCINYAEKLYGKDDWHCELYRNRLAKTLIQAGHVEDAIPIATKAYTAFRDKVGPDHVYTQAAAKNLVLAFEALEDEATAVLWREKLASK